MQKYLKSEQEYIDLWDRITVEHCRHWEEILNKDSTPLILKGKQISKKGQKSAEKIISGIALYCISGQQHERKAETIREWMRRDEEKDRLLASTIAPANIRCLICHSLMTATYKDIHDWGLEKRERILFMYDCPLGHLPRRAFFDNGEEWKRTIPKCPKCEHSLTDTDVRDGDVITTTETCASCGFARTSTLDLTPKTEIKDKTFEADRKRFCFTEEQGKQYFDTKIRLEAFSEILKKEQEKEKHKELYEKAEKLKKLTVIELEKLLAPALEVAGYARLQFGIPDMGKDVFLPFTLQDTKSERTDRESSYDLERLLRKTLADTNWRLMSEGVSYRVGFLSGRLRAYEREDDLVELIRVKERKRSDEKTLEEKL
ncbi:MAG: hypothetical protein AAB518_02275 [Patescibacteria group bacterium]